MRTTVTAFIILCLIAPVASAQDDALGLYFSDSEFTQETAGATNSLGFMLAGYIVLTNATGVSVAGYEVAITCTAPDFAIPMTNLTFDANAGTNSNQIITFMSPKPVEAGGTVLATIFITTDSINPEEISFGPADPSSLPGVPVVDYVTGDAVACSQPFGTPVVGWLNGEAVSVQSEAWGNIKALYR